MKNLSDLRALNESELNQELLELRKQQFKLRLQKASGALEKSHHINAVRKSIARIKTLLTEKAGN